MWDEDSVRLKMKSNEPPECVPVIYIFQITLENKGVGEVALK